MAKILDEWLSPSYLRSLLIDSDLSKSRCIQIARFTAAYYLDFLLFEPPNPEHNLPSLYIWESFERLEDLPQGATPLDRGMISQRMPAEYSPALPALLLVKCDHLIEAISYVDHFDDRRSALILRLLADSIHQKDLTTDYIKSMILEGVGAEIDLRLKNNTLQKFATQLATSIVELDVSLQKDLTHFLEETLVNTAEYHFSQLPIQSDKSDSENPVYTPPMNQESPEARIHANIHIALSALAASNRLTAELNFTLRLMSRKVTPNATRPPFILHRILLLALRATYRAQFTDAVVENSRNVAKIARRYKMLLGDEAEEVILVKWAADATENEMEYVEKFFEFVQMKFKQSSNLPPLSRTTREIWLRRIVLNNSTDHRDVREERHIDWFRSICHPRHRVCDVVISQMLLINSQWTSPGFSKISAGCHALRLAIHPHDLCLGTNNLTANYTMSARDIVCNPISELNNEERLFTPRADLVSIYARKHREMRAMTSRTPIDMRIGEFGRQQIEILNEVDREREFLSRSTISDVSTRNNEVELAAELEKLNMKIDSVVRRLEEKEKEKNRSMYIKEDEEEISDAEELPYFYETAPIAKESPMIEKLDLGNLSERVEKLTTLSTANSLEELTPTNELPPTLLPLEQPASAFANLLTCNEITPRVEKVRKVVSDESRCAGTQTSGEELSKRVIQARKMNKEEIWSVLNRIS